MENPNWVNFKKSYSELFKVDDKILDLIAVEPILQFIVSGFANSKIASILDLDEEYVKTVSEEFLDFPGNSVELEFNPLYCYRGIDFLDTVWYIRCKVYDEIRRKVDEFYDTIA